MKTITRELPNGDLYRVQVDDNYKDPMQEAEERMMVATSGIAGQNQCGYCGQAFMSGGTLSDHIKIRHSVAAGLEDTRPVPMPDGSIQPAALVPELAQDHLAILEEEMQSKFDAREAELQDKLGAAENQNSLLATKLEELAARLSGLEDNGAANKNTS